MAIVGILSRASLYCEIESPPVRLESSRVRLRAPHNTGELAMKAHFTMFAAYNAWANRRLYDASAQMSDEARRAEAGAFFGALYNTLTHILVGDRIWMHRFTGVSPT